MARYTDEEMSRILGEHSAGQLKRLGEYYWGLEYIPIPRGCVNQVAYNESSPVRAVFCNEQPAIRFDSRYEPGMTVEGLIALLDEGEFAFGTEGEE